MSQKERLSPKQAAFLAELLAGKTVTEAAAKVGVARRTATTWRGLPAISDAIEWATREAIEAGGVTLTGLTRLAVSTLERQMRIEGTPPAVQVQAARTVLTTVFELGLASEMAERIERLERLLQGELDNDNDQGSE